MIAESAASSIEEMADHIIDRMLGPDAHDDVALMIIQLPTTLTYPFVTLTGLTPVDNHEEVRS